MTRIFSLGLSTLAALVAGCAYPNQFRNVQAESPHASLDGDGVKLTHINDQPTSFWRSRESFCISPGSTTVRVISGYRGDVHFPLLRFPAEAHHNYTVQRQQGAGSDCIVLRDGRQQIVAKLKRERRR